MAMSLINVARKWLSTLAPALVAPLPSTPCIQRRLRGGESARYGDASGRVLCCLAGSLWITHDGDPKDVIVEAGESYHVARRELMIVHALRDSAIRMT
jgi:hypothetical protein